jgi:putative protease
VLCPYFFVIAITFVIASFLEVNDLKKIELLAPAGDQESFVAAIQNGADAIYLGGTLFNARAFAKNFDDEQLQWAVQYAHCRDVKVYVTVNTLYKDKEFPLLLEYIDRLYHFQVDALIIQDIGLFDVVKHAYPDFEIHMSTQSSIMNNSAVQYFEQIGASRVVLARENTLLEIKDICQSTKLEIEVFIHGAICICYSGQCLMSSMIGKRSGNRGACAQPCRLQYQLVEDGKILDNKIPFLLSPKDMMTIEHIPELIEAGVTSLKIEGRMKRPEYVASVVKAYRHAIDNYYQHQSSDYQEDIADMQAMFNRNYTQGYLMNDPYLLDGDYSGNKGVEIGQVVRYISAQKRVVIALNKTLNQGDSIVFEKIDKGRPVNKIYIHGKLVANGNPGDLVEVEFDYPVSQGIVRKTVDTKVISQLHKTYDKEYRQIPLKITFKAKINQPAELTFQHLQEQVKIESHELVEKALKTPLTQERICQQLSKLKDTPFFVEQITIDSDDNITLPIKTLNQMRRECSQLLSQLLSNKKIHYIIPFKIPSYQQIKTDQPKQLYVQVSHLEQLNAACQLPVNYIIYPYQSDIEEAYQVCQHYQKTLIMGLPHVLKQKDINDIQKSAIYSHIDTILVNDYGAYYAFQDKKRIVGTGCNIYNSYAASHYIEKRILSLEMSLQEINQLNVDFSDCIVQVYGKVENMISEYCPISQYYYGYQKKNCQICKKHQFSLIDRKKEKFDLMMDEQCRMHLLNCRTLYFDKIYKCHSQGLFIHFTNETQELTKFVIEHFISLLKKEDKSRLKEKISTTYGYYKE